MPINRTAVRTSLNAPLIDEPNVGISLLEGARIRQSEKNPKSQSSSVDKAPLSYPQSILYWANQLAAFTSQIVSSGISESCALIRTLTRTPVTLYKELKMIDLESDQEIAQENEYIFDPKKLASLNNEDLWDLTTLSDLTIKAFFLDCCAILKAHEDIKSLLPDEIKTEIKDMMTQIQLVITRFGVRKSYDRLSKLQKQVEYEKAIGIFLDALNFYQEVAYVCKVLYEHDYGKNVPPKNFKLLTTFQSEMEVLLEVIADFKINYSLKQVRFNTNITLDDLLEIVKKPQHSLFEYLLEHDICYQNELLNVDLLASYKKTHNKVSKQIQERGINTDDLGHDPLLEFVHRHRKKVTFFYFSMLSFKGVHHTADRVLNHNFVANVKKVVFGNPLQSNPSSIIEKQTNLRS